MFSRHDFIETADGLLFAVVAGGEEQGRVLCFLRYAREVESFVKFDTAQANQLLGERWPRYLVHSPARDADLHGVPVDEVRRHHRPRAKAVELTRRKEERAIAGKCGRLIACLAARGVGECDIGVTGSLLIGAQTDDSDIDLVIYGRPSFHLARSVLADGCVDGTFSELSRQQWRQAHRRRGCALSLAEYIWHERRKQNKAVFEGTKFDISQGEAGSDPRPTPVKVKKLDETTVVARVVDATKGFDFPARWQVNHERIDEVLSFTPTYTAAAFAGEVIEVRGIVEQLCDGRRRIVVGTSREAPRQWIKVVREVSP